MARRKNTRRRNNRRGTIRVTREEQRRAGYDSPRAYSDALTDLENRGISTAEAVRNLSSGGGVKSEDREDPGTSLFKESAAYKSLSSDLRGLVDFAIISFSGTEE